MIARVTRRPRARADLLEQFVHFPVHGFENYLIFYLPGPGGIDLIRVLHGARDIDNLFAQEG